MKSMKALLLSALVFLALVGVAHAMDEDSPSSVVVPDEKEKDTFMEAFLASLSMIIVSELGDKTFFIAAIMAMRHSRVVVLTGAFAALAVQTVLSTALGQVALGVISLKWTTIVGGVLFLIFGIRLLYEAYGMQWRPDGPNEEMQEVLEELKAKRRSLEDHDQTKTSEPSDEEVHTLLDTPDDPELGNVDDGKEKKQKSGWSNKILIQAFVMTFLAEWGDRSQITTIVMAASKNAYGVTVGGSLGHLLCTGLAVAGGKLMATKISEKAVSIAGGVLFLLFAAHSFMTYGDVD